MPDGKRLKGKSLGGNVGIDSGMAKITEPGKYPFTEMGKVGDLKKGTWCLSIGHPGGFKEGRTPVVRVGRILENTASLVRTDCTLVGGDSGGPLFDMHGRVIGIHSRIGGNITDNMHVPVDTYRDTWDRLVKAEVWGGFNFPNFANAPYLGIEGDPDGKDARITKIIKGSAAEKAGLKAGDVITKVDDSKVASTADITRTLRGLKSKKTFNLTVMRNKKEMPLSITLDTTGGTVRASLDVVNC